MDRPGQRADRVLGVEELHPRVEAEDRRDDRQPHEARDRRVEARADDRLQAQERRDDVRVAAGEAVDEVLELGDVALEARARRRAPAPGPR